LEDSACTTIREHDLEEEMGVKTALTRVDNRRSGSSSFEVSTSKQNPSPLPLIDEQPRQSTPPSATQVVSTDKVDEPGNQGMEIIDVDMDDDNDDDVTIVPPIQTTTVVKPDAEQDIQPTDDSRNFKEEQESQSDLEMQRQRQRQARRGPTPSSSPQARSRKTLPMVSKTGVKRDREEYEEGQVDEDDHDHDVGIDEPSIVPEEKPNGSPVQGPISTETQTIPADADDNSGIVILERELKDDMPKQQKDKVVSTNGRQVTPQTGIKIATFSTGKGPNPKALGKRSHYREPPISLTSLRSFVTTPQQSTTSLPLPSPQPRLPKKLGINHMDLLYKTEREVMVCRICL
jgi:hypothetical protein